jgi:hypothetical protein
MKGALQGRLLPRRPLTARRYSAMCRLDKLIQGGSFIQTQPSRDLDRIRGLNPIR